MSLSPFGSCIHDFELNDTFFFGWSPIAREGAQAGPMMPTLGLTPRQIGGIGLPIESSNGIANIFMNIPNLELNTPFFLGGDPKKKVYSTQNHDISAPETCDRPAGRIQSSELVLQMLPVSSNLVGSAYISLGAKDLGFLS